MVPASTPAALLDQLRSKERLTRVNARKRLFDLPTKTAIPATDAWIATLEKDQDYERMLMTAAGIYAAHEVVDDVLGLAPLALLVAIGLVGTW